MSDDLLSLENFSGVARLFPLPNLVMFPFVVQPLHIFEPRYRQMLADTLADDRLLAMVLLAPGWEENYHLRPRIHPVACLGKVFKEERLPDGRYNLLLHGLRRVRIRHELKTDKLYRSAEVEVLRDVSDLGLSHEQALRTQLGEVVPAWMTTHGNPTDQIDKLMQSDLTLATLCDIFSFALPLAIELKQRLLEELDIGKRSQLLLSTLQAALPTPPTRLFPPPFSEN